MDEKQQSYESPGLERSDAAISESLPSFQIVHLDQFAPSFPIEEAKRERYVRRFVTLFVDESRTKIGGNGTLLSVTNAYGERFALKVTDTPCDHEYEMHRRVSGIQGYPKLFGRAELNGKTAFVMEWVEGEDLSRLRSRLSVDDEGRLSPLTVARLGRDVFDALARASVLEDKVVHSDLSMRNVMVSTLDQSIEEQASNGAFDVRIIDFGSALFESQDEGRSEKVAATPEFAAPELEHGIFTTAADVHAVSRILELLLHGSSASTAVHGDDNDISAVLLREPEVAVTVARVAAEFTPMPEEEEIRAALERIDRQLEEILRYGIEPDPKRRPSASVMRDMLTSFSLSYQTNVRLALQGDELEPLTPPFASGKIDGLSLKARNRIRLVGKSLSMGMLFAVLAMTAWLVVATPTSAIWGVVVLEGIAAEMLVPLLVIPPVVGFLLRGRGRLRLAGLGRATMGIVAAASIVAILMNVGDFDPPAFKRLMTSAVFATSVMGWCPLVLDCAFPAQRARTRKSDRKLARLSRGKRQKMAFLDEGGRETGDEVRS